MKRILTVICILLAICMLSTTTVFAQSAPAADSVDAIDVVDADAASVGDSYTLTDGGEPVLEVAHVHTPGLTAALSDRSNGYYTAEFMLPETNYQVYLTGLTQDNTEEIRQMIINAYTEGGDFDLTNLGFIDAEKTWADDGDENLCWAASTSNLLTYTGWAAQVGFVSTDDVFEAFISAFDDNGGNVEFATGWFINGVAAPGGAQPAAGTGGYLPQYNYSDIAYTYDVYQEGADGMKTAYDKLRNGYGVSLSTDIYGTGGYEGGHAVTCWGFVTDIRYPKTSKQFYKNVFITDSDSDKYWVQGGKDRRDADDVMSLYALESVEQEGIDTFLFHITDQQSALITEVITVAPFSDDIPYETSDEATLNTQTTPDITIDPFILTDDVNDKDHTITTFAPNTTIYYQPYMMNVANTAYTGRLRLVVTVTDEQGDTVYSRTFNYSSSTISPSSGSAFGKESITPKLPVGDYTITASFNPDHEVAEAYFFNNTRSIDFKVRESYKLGDTDGDGSISVVDATLIQRVLAHLVVTLDENAAQRGDINESGDLDLLDVTYIQRHLAGLEIPYAVNDSRYYQ